MFILNHYSSQIIGPIFQVEKLTTDDSLEVNFLLTLKVLRAFHDSNNQPVYDFLNCLVPAPQFYALKNDSLIGETAIISGSLTTLVCDGQEQLLLQAHSVVLKSAYAQHAYVPAAGVVENNSQSVPIIC